MTNFTVVHVVIYYNQPLRYKYSDVKTFLPEHNAGTKLRLLVWYLIPWSLPNMTLCRMPTVSFLQWGFSIKSSFNFIVKFLVNYSSTCNFLGCQIKLILSRDGEGWGEGFLDRNCHPNSCWRAMPKINYHSVVMCVSILSLMGRYASVELHLALPLIIWASLFKVRLI